MMENRIKDIGARNMPAESVAAGFPFVYSGLNDGEGILLGTDKGGGIILCDFWTRRESRTNSNLTVIGRPCRKRVQLLKRFCVVNMVVEQKLSL